MANLRDRIVVGRHIKLQALLFGVIAGCMGLFLYGLLMYTDAPYQLCAGGAYCGKGGVPHSYATYMDWKRWEALLFVCWPFGMAAAFALRRLRT